MFGMFGSASVSNVVVGSGVEQQVTFTNGTGQLILNVPNPNGYVAANGAGALQFQAYGSSVGTMRVALQTQIGAFSDLHRVYITNEIYPL